jgi:hypothetical protein
MKNAILPQSDVGKTKEEIQDNFNSYPVMIGREDATTAPAQSTLTAFCYEVNGTCT